MKALKGACCFDLGKITAVASPGRKTQAQSTRDDREQRGPSERPGDGDYHISVIKDEGVHAATRRFISHADAYSQNMAWQGCLTTFSFQDGAV